MPESRVANSSQALTPRLRRLLVWLLVAFGIMVVDSLYLVGLSWWGWFTNANQETLLSIWAFLLHVVLGLALIVPLVVYGIGHMLRARRSPNINARRVGYVLFGTALILLVSGVLLLRIEGVPNPVASGGGHDLTWWIHVLAPLVLIWLFIAHRMVGPRIRWQVGARWGVVTGVFLLAMFGLHWSLAVETPSTAPRIGMPGSFATTVGNVHIPVEELTAIDSCVSCHPDAHASWSHSAHRFASFDNPVYAAAVRQTRRVEPEMSTFCAGCHDPVLLASGSFGDARLDDPHADLSTFPGAHAGVNCLVCHSIVHATPEGNGSWVMERPQRYPFYDSESSIGQWINRQLILSRPGFHKRAMLKPGVTDSALMCGSCHKAWIPEGLNHYRWLAGQNHYDSWRLSGVSGHGVGSWRWPEEPSTDCNSCHMELQPSTGIAARVRDDSGVPTVHDHLFAGGNTALAVLLDLPEREAIIAAHQRILDESMRVDIVGLRSGGALDGSFIGPIRPELPKLDRGGTYLLEVVCRNTGTGHAFTQGTADSNEIWLDVTVRSGGRVIGRSGAIDEQGIVDPWAYRLNAFVVDSAGHRVESRAPEQMFTSVYDHQVPPGAASVTHYRLDIPDDAADSVEIDVVLRYRKFDHRLMAYVYGEEKAQAIVNELPAMVVARDSVELPLTGGAGLAEKAEGPAPNWERLYDYGIGLFRHGSRGPLRQAVEAFEQVAALGRSEGFYGLGRTFLMQGRYEEAVEALRTAASENGTMEPWGVTFYSGVTDLERGLLASARERFRALAVEQARRFPQATARGFYFAGDDALLLDLAETELRIGLGGEVESSQQALQLTGEVIARNPQNARAWWLRAQALQATGGTPQEIATARRQHTNYRPDEQAAERAVREARKRYPPVDVAAEPSAIYDLRRSKESR